MPKTSSHFRAEMLLMARFDVIVPIIDKYA